MKHRSRARRLVGARLVVLATLLIVIAAQAALPAGSPAAAITGTPDGQRTTVAAAPRKVKPPVNVVLIGWDGAQRAHVKECFSRGELPTLQGVADKGRLVAVDVVRTTDTKAGWSQILTGLQPEKTGVFSNSRYQTIPAGLTIFERLEQAYGSGFVTVAVVAKKDHVGYEAGLPFANAAARMEHFDNGLVEDEAVATRAMDYLEEYKDRSFFFFIHFGQPDAAGHAKGENSQEYTDGLVADDYWTGKILDKLRELGLKGRTAVYVTADHGFDEGRTSHNDAPYVFLATTDKGVMRRGLREDIAPTIYDRLGLSRNGFSPALDGHSLRRPYTPPRW